jgi:hypothetical protein
MPTNGPDSLASYRKRHFDETPIPTLPAILLEMWRSWWGVDGIEDGDGDKRIAQFLD